MGDFIAFGGGTDVKQNKSIMQKPTTPKPDLKTGLKLSGMPAFGSPAINFGGTQIPFGSPAIVPQKTNTSMQNTSPSPNPRYPNYQSTPRGDHRQNFSPRNRPNYSPRQQSSYSPRHQGSYSPRHQNSYSPRHQGSYSPRHQSQNSFQFTPSPYNVRNQSRDSSENSSFKTPQFSPGPMRGGRWSFNRQKNSRYDPNSNAGGSTNIEDYYNHSMVQDPWKNLCPVIVSTR